MTKTAKVCPQLAKRGSKDKKNTKESYKIANGVQKQQENDLMARIWPLDGKKYNQMTARR